MAGHGRGKRGHYLCQSSAQTLLYPSEVLYLVMGIGEQDAANGAVRPGSAWEWRRKLLIAQPGDEGECICAGGGQVGQSHLQVVAGMSINALLIIAMDAGK